MVQRAVVVRRLVCPDPMPPRDTGGSDLGQLPSLPRLPLPHLYWSGLGRKGSVQPWPWECPHCSPYLFLLELPEGGAASPRSPQGLLFHNHPKGLKKEPLQPSAPFPLSRAQDMPLPFTPSFILCPEPGTH